MDMGLELEPGQRSRLLAVAYRMLGSLADAEDAVQEGYTRWYALPPAEREVVGSPTGWLITAVSRVCLDVLGSARARRERYSGPWLPEPLPNTWTTSIVDLDAIDPADRVTLDESLTFGVLTVLERLTPAERVAFVLHDVFGYPFKEIAAIVGRRPGACRQLASAARRAIRTQRRNTIEPSELARAVEAFKSAWQLGDIGALITQLDPDAIAIIDAGGMVNAAPAPLIGAPAIAEFFVGVHQRQADIVVRETSINGRPGLVARDATQHILATVAFGLRDILIHELWVTRNPDKLAHWTTD